MGIAVPVHTQDAVSGLLDDYVLCRVAAQRGATRSDLLKDLAPCTSHKLSPSELRRMVDQAVASLAGQGLIATNRARLGLAPAGIKRVRDYLGCRTIPEDWAEIRDIRLVGHALGLGGESEQRIKTLARPDGLRAAILQQAYGLPGKRVPSPTKLRCMLAVVALERAFGNKVKSAFESGKGLSAKAGRLLAGQLSRRPRDFGTDARLISALAAEACGSPQSDIASLRLAILRNALAHNTPRPLALVVDRQRPVPNVEEVELAVAGNRPAAATRPDLPGFAKVIVELADTLGDGWPGNKKAFISRVWQTVQADYPEWGLTDIEFKAMLTEAHRTGHLVLANADLRSKDNAADIQASAISYKNTVWHYVRATN